MDQNRVLALESISSPTQPGAAPQLLLKVAPAALTLLVLVAMAAPAFAFKVNTHFYTANEVRQSIIPRNGQFFVEIDGREHRIPAAVGQAIRNYPQYFRAGVVGPDGYPDIVFGQKTIHPDNHCEDPNEFGDDCEPIVRCEIGVDGASNCDAAGDDTVTDEWLRYVYDAAVDRYLTRCGVQSLAQACPDRIANRALSFAYGFLLHAAGDMWAHTLVNEYSEGVFPPMSEIAGQFENGNQPLRDIAIRHVVVESYIGKRTPAMPTSEMAFQAPLGFLNELFIDPMGLDVPTPLARGSLIDFFHQTQRALAGFDCTGIDTAMALRPDIAVREVIDAFAGEDVFGMSACNEFKALWDHEIRIGLLSWIQSNERISRKLFVDEDFSGAFLMLDDFASNHLIYMLGMPRDPIALLDLPPGAEESADLVAEAVSVITNEIVEPVIAGLRREFRDIDPIRAAKAELAKFIMNELYGVTPANVESMFTQPAIFLEGGCPASWPGCPAFFSPDARDRLDGEMGVTSNSRLGQPLAADAPFTTADFAAVANTVTLGKLMLLDPAEVDRLLYERHVGTVYTDSLITNEEFHDYRFESVQDAGKPRNVMLGFIRSIDANHQWRLRSPSTAWAPGTRYSEAMPIWEDCLARERFFRSAFVDRSAAIGATPFPDDGEVCEVLGRIEPATLELYIDDVLVPGPGYSFDTTTCRGARIEARAVNHQDASQTFGLYLALRDSAGRIVDHAYTASHRADQRPLAPQPLGEESVTLRPPCVTDAYTVEAYLFDSLRFLEIERNDPIGAVLPRYAEPVAYKKTVGLIVQQGDCGSGTDDGSLLVDIPNTTTSGSGYYPGWTPDFIPTPPSEPAECSGFEIPSALDLDEDGVKDVDDNCAFHANASENGVGRTSADGMGASCNPKLEMLTASAPFSGGSGRSRTRITTSPATVGSADPICYACRLGAPSSRVPSQR